MKSFDCNSCGALLEFQPNKETLQCPYCESTVPIPKSTKAIRELNFRDYLEKLESQAESFEQQTVDCTACGAQTTFQENLVASECPYCDTPLVMTKTSKKGIKPRSLLPFKIVQQVALEKFRAWLKTRWFAPNKLKSYAQRGVIKGVYVPHWTYDSYTRTQYTGQRGEHYWVTETYTETVNGQSETKTRQVRKTRWYPASGTVSRNFDDVLVVASESLPRSYAEALEPWDLEALVPYQDEYLSGFQAESYGIDLRRGFERAKELMAPTIYSDIKRDIGGDEQRVSSQSTTYNNVTFKHILLPIWISSYRFKEKVYRFLVNARTGEVQGERPYSIWKIFFFTLFVIGIIIAGYKIYEHFEHG
ncbi:MAG: hypothetical protein P1V97_18725 [Planctomycetota bacterium]|nr:hypothetical protein [Planctomycetota bacterium]